MIRAASNYDVWWFFFLQIHSWAKDLIGIPAISERDGAGVGRERLNLPLQPQPLVWQLPSDIQHPFTKHGLSLSSVSSGHALCQENSLLSQDRRPQPMLLTGLKSTNENGKLKTFFKGWRRNVDLFSCLDLLLCCALIFLPCPPPTCFLHSQLVNSHQINCFSCLPLSKPIRI